MTIHAHAASDTIVRKSSRSVRRYHSPAYVVIVNGYGDSRDMYAEYLRFHDFVVDAVSNPTEALRLIGLSTPDVIVTDFVFPTGQIDGPDFVARARLAMAGQHPFVIVISGFTQRADETRARQAGADRFLLKPCLPKALLREIENVRQTRSEQHAAVPRTRKLRH